jgi:hypothetical protein
MSLSARFSPESWMVLTDIHRMTAIVELILPPWADIGNLGPSSCGSRHAEKGGVGAQRTGNADFAFIKTHLSRGSCLNG